MLKERKRISAMVLPVTGLHKHPRTYEAQPNEEGLIVCFSQNSWNINSV